MERDRTKKGKGKDKGKGIGQGWGWEWGWRWETGGDHRIRKKLLSAMQVMHLERTPPLFLEIPQNITTRK